MIVRVLGMTVYMTDGYKIQIVVGQGYDEVVGFRRMHDRV